ncbi:MAG: arylsulfatase [Verrucomicrobia bacterium]|nr:arylsulfatase [Verrucomicrobiota bacterium]
MKKIAVSTWRLCFALTAGVPGLQAAVPAPQKPNVIIILADDVGYSDLGCYGGEIATPNLDALASGGVRFTQFYNTARCCPTRASLLTGLYPHQAGIGHMMDDKGVDGYRGDLNRRSITLAEALKPAGYRSYAVGKWHVTPGATAAALANRKNWPLQRGFERYYGTIHGAGSFWDPSSLVRDNTLLTVASDPDYRPAEYYYTDAISDHATRFIREHARDHARQPFLLYVAYTAAHWPMHARTRAIASYRGRYDAGYAAIRDARWEKQKKLGVADAKWGTAPLVGDWANVSNKEFETRCMEVYAAMLSTMDQGIGRIVAQLKAAGQLDNTVICYLQDNGGCAETNGRVGAFTPRAAQPSLPPMAKDAPQFSSKPDQTRDGWPVRQGYGVLPGPADTYVAYGRDWANVSNTPFREYKHWVHEGGISTPLIVHWPAGMKAERRRDPAMGRLCSEPSHLIDIMATCVDLAGAKYPARFNGQPIHPMEGRSLKPLLVSSSPGPSVSPPLRPLYWEHEGNRAIRSGQWKLVSKHPGGWELYDIEADRAEQHDLSAQHSDRVKTMAAQWEAWAKRAGVEPWPVNAGAAGKAGKKAGKK